MNVGYIKRFVRLKMENMPIIYVIIVINAMMTVSDGLQKNLKNQYWMK